MICVSVAQCFHSCNQCICNLQRILIFYVVDDGSAIQDYLHTLTGARSVPRVFVGGKFIGGGSEVKDLQEKGKLVPILNEAGAL